MFHLMVDNVLKISPSQWLYSNTLVICQNTNEFKGYYIGDVLVGVNVKAII